MQAGQNRRRRPFARLEIINPVHKTSEALTWLAARADLPRPRARWLLAFLAGALTTFGFAPFDFVPVLLASFTCLVWQIDAVGDAPKPFRAAAAVGWWFGFGYHVAGIHWIGFAFLVDAQTHGWMIPFVAIAMPGGLALFTALFGTLARVLFDQVSGQARVAGFAVLWMVFEWLRGNILTGFPWNLAGYTWASILPVAQTASVIGIYGLSLLTVMLAASPAALTTRKDGVFVRARAGVIAPALCFGLVVLAGLWGQARLLSATPGTVEGVRLRIVQPSIPQREKWKPENRGPIFREYLELTARQGGGGDITHVIWPESAIPFLLGRTPGALEATGRSLIPGKVLLTGAARMDEDLGSPTYFNAVHMINSTGAIVDTYDKYHLVPFGEYLPFQGLMSRLGLKQLVEAAGGFNSGPGPRSFDVPGAGRVMPLICYEAIFPGRVSRGPGPRPDWLLNVTNDAWFGTTTGPRQHLAQARFRAIEEGLPLVRSANTGISAIVDAHGRIEARLGLGRSGVLEGPLPAPLAPTLYARWGDRVFWIMMVLLAVWPGFSRVRQARAPAF